jgi:hypothetical protein
VAQLATDSVDSVGHQTVRFTAPSPSSSDRDGSDIESCFDTEDEQEETGADTNPLTDVNANIDGDPIYYE